jgi:HTH-type transcriptional regulator / antitoxin HigA
MNIKPIRTPKDHATALKQIERLWPAAGTETPEGEALEILSTLVEAYERKHFPIPCPDPISAINFRLEQGAIQKRDLQKTVFRTSGRMSEVLNRRRALNLTMIRKLHGRYEIPLECLVAQYRLRKPRAHHEDRRRP